MFYGKAVVFFSYRFTILYGGSEIYYICLSLVLPPLAVRLAAVCLSFFLIIFVLLVFLLVVFLCLVFFLYIVFDFLGNLEAVPFRRQHQGAVGLLPGPVFRFRTLL